MSNDFFEISPIKQKVTIETGEGERDYLVIGIPFKIFLDLVARFPDLGKIIEGGTIDVPSVMQYGADAVASLVAAGWGMPNDKKAEEKAATLMPEQTLDFLHGILKATMPNGLGPFKAKLDAIGAIVQIKKEQQKEEPPANVSQPSAAPPEAKDFPQKTAGSMKWKFGPDGEIVLTVPKNRNPSDNDLQLPLNSSSQKEDIRNQKFGT